MRYYLRRNSQGLTREQVKSYLPRLNFFKNRVVNDWNKLPREVITAKNLNGLKAKLDASTRNLKRLLKLNRALLGLLPGYNPTTTTWFNLDAVN